MGKSSRQKRPSYSSISFRGMLSKTMLLFLASIAILNNQNRGFAQAAGQDNIDVQLGQPTNYYKLSSNEVAYFQVKLRQGEFTGREDLLIKVQSSEHKGDPDLYISKKNTNPNSKSNSDQACETSGRDICSINHSQLTANQYIYMGVKCLEDCRFKLIASLMEPIILEDAADLQLDFHTDETKLFRFYVPAGSASKDEENRVSSVTLTASPILSQQDNIILTATAVKDETPNTKSSRGVPGWRKGQVLRLSEQSGTDWCTDCWINILVDVTENGKYSIIGKSNVGVSQLQADIKVDDVAFFGDKTCYKYYVQNTESDFVLKVQQYSGLISFTVNPKKPAESYDSAAFRYVGTQNSVLKITPNERRNVSQPKGLYYICAVPHMTSTFSIVITEPSRNQLFTYLEDSYDETGEIQGSDLVLYIYKVPPLEYKGEDIQLNFKLNVISGKAPFLGVAFCMDKKDHKKCVQGLKSSEITSSGSSFTKGTQVGNDMYIIVNHDERTCQDEYNGQCYYVIALVGQQKDEEFTTYTVSVNHSQLNYQLLSENQVVTDFVNMGAQKYYSFTLMQDKKVKNVTFKLNTLHGDADLYVSRIHPYPTKIEYEKSSVKTNIDQDEVSFDSGNLSTTYFVLVQSFQYSSYTLLVKVQREGVTWQDLGEAVPQINEGVPMRGKITGYEHTENYKIYIKQLEGYEKSIRIQLQPVKGKFEFYVNYGEKASSEKHFTSSKENFIEIKSTDKNFKREGFYYINIRPRKNIWSIITDDNYEYVLTYSTQDSYSYISSKEPLDTQQSANTSQYFRHFINFNQKGQDVSISMTVFGGNPVMFISINPENKFPTKEQFDYSSKSLVSLLGNNGKSVYISRQKIQSSSESCQPEIENYVDVEPCAIFVGVFCENECKYSLKLSYEKGAPQKLTFGVPQHDVVKDGSFNYYYMIVREGKQKQIYAVLNSLSGNADLYVNFQDNPQNSSPEKWRLPTSSQYIIKSTEVLKQDMINIQESQMKDCFGRYTGGEDQSERICAIVFGVYSPTQNANSDDDDSNTRFNFVVYSDIIFIQNSVVMSGKVNEKEFQYYFFDALCEDCPIVVSVSTFSNGDPDLYINYGDHSLPTKTTYDIHSSTYKSELIRISLDSDEVKDASIKSLKGSWIIGVYGNRQSNFQISVTQDKNPIQQLIPGMALKVSQQPYQTTFFMYYHDKDQTDLEMIIDPSLGSIDIYVSKFNDLDQTQNFADKLPKSKRNAIWTQENIKPQSTHDDKTITILNEEKEFCDKCYYLVGVSSQDKRSDYSIMIHPLDATFANSLLLKIGEIQSYAMKKGEKATFKFITDESEDISVEFNLKQGHFRADASYSEDTSKSFAVQNGGGILKIEKTKVNPGQIIYLLVDCDLDATFTIQVKQDRSILSLRDGQTQKVLIKGDLAKHFIFQLPSGDQSLTIQLKTTLDNFYPVLMFQELDDVSSPSSISFPPAGGKYNSFFNWDRNFGILTAQKNLKVKGDKGGLAVSIYNGNLNTFGEVYITASVSSLVTLYASQTYQGVLRTENSFMIYQADQYFGLAKGFIRIEFADCRGTSQVQILDNVNGHQSRVANIDLKEQYRLGRTYYHVPLPRKNLYVMVKPNLNSWNRDQEFEPHHYILKVKFVPTLEYESPEQRFQETNKLSLESFSGIFQTANMTWKPIFLENSDGMIAKADQNYVLIVTQDSNLNIESICQASTSNFTKKDDMTRTYMINQTHHEISNIKYDERYYINVFSRVRYHGNDDIEVIPYEPYELHMRSPSYFKLSNILLFIFGLLIAASAYQLYKKSTSSSNKTYYREKVPSRQVEYELTSVANRPNAGEYQVPSDLINSVSETDQLNSSRAGF
eukprot:403343241